MTFGFRALPVTAVMAAAIGQNASCQELNKNAIKLGLGVGASAGLLSSGFGYNYSVGYQRNIWRDRLRLNPNLSIGHYSSRLIQDAGDQYFNSINLETNLLFDLLKSQYSSLVVGTGVLVNYTRGLIGSGGDTDFGNPSSDGTKYINNLHLGYYLGCGIRLINPDKRTTICIMPFNLHLGTNYFLSTILE